MALLCDAIARRLDQSMFPFFPVEQARKLENKTQTSKHKQHAPRRPIQNTNGGSMLGMWFSVFWVGRDTPETQPRHGLHRVYTGSTQGLHRVYTDLHQVYTRSTQGLHRVYTGSTQGLRSPRAGFQNVCKRRSQICRQRASNLMLGSERRRLIH